jgi:hypothetical protein
MGSTGPGFSAEYYPQITGPTWVLGRNVKTGDYDPYFPYNYGWVMTSLHSDEHPEYY